MDEREAYVECKVCSRRLLVECTVWLNLASGAVWCYDPEDLPEGWGYTCEPYPISKTFIYCLDHVGDIEGLTLIKGQ